MTNKIALSLVALLLTISAFVLSFAARFILYKHVGATEVMWLLFIIDIPLNVVLQVFSKALMNEAKDQK